MAASYNWLPKKPLAISDGAPGRRRRKSIRGPATAPGAAKRPAAARRWVLTARRLDFSRCRWIRENRERGSEPPKHPTADHSSCSATDDRREDWRARKWPGIPVARRSGGLLSLHLPCCTWKSCLRRLNALDPSDKNRKASRCKRAPWQRRNRRPYPGGRAPLSREWDKGRQRRCLRYPSLRAALRRSSRGRRRGRRYPVSDRSFCLSRYCSEALICAPILFRRDAPAGDLARYDW